MSYLTKIFVLYSTVVFILSSCTTIATHFPGVYAIDVEQGNIIDQDMIDQLRPNMNKRQVLYIMGSPMLVDVFHQDRWDYVYSEQPGGEDRLQKRISLYFQDDILTGVQGDFRPSSVPVMRPSNEETVDVPRRVLEKTLFEKITGLFSSDDIDTQPVAEPDLVEQDATSQTQPVPDEFISTPADGQAKKDPLRQNNGETDINPGDIQKPAVAGNIESALPENSGNSLPKAY